MSKPDSLQGSLDLLVLKILSRRPRLHGYAIMSAVRDRSADVLRVEDERFGRVLGADTPCERPARIEEDRKGVTALVRFERVAVRRGLCLGVDGEDVDPARVIEGVELAEPSVVRLLVRAMVREEKENRDARIPALSERMHRAVGAEKRRRGEPGAHDLGPGAADGRERERQETASSEAHDHPHKTVSVKPPVAVWSRPNPDSGGLTKRLACTRR